MSNCVFCNVIHHLFRNDVFYPRWDLSSEKYAALLRILSTVDAILNIRMKIDLN